MLSVSDYLLEIDGIDGESASNTPARIEIETFSFGAANSPVSATGSAGAATIFEFVKAPTHRKPAGYMTYELKDVLISTYQIGGSSGDVLPTETFSINFAAIHAPRIGQEVVVDYLEGDPDKPIIVRSLGDTDLSDPITPPAGFESLINDLGRFEQINVHAGTDQGVTVERDETHWVGQDHMVTIEHDETVVVKHDRTETVDNNETITISGNRTETVSQGETIHVDVYRDPTISGDETITVNVNRGSSATVNESITIGANQNVTIGIYERRTIGPAQNVGKTLVIDASESITLKSGDAAVVMNGDGAITIQGSNVAANGEGSNLVINGFGLLIGSNEYFNVNTNAQMPSDVLFCVQYRETDFNFASRLMEEEGIFYFFGPGGGSIAGADLNGDGIDDIVVALAPSGLDPAGFVAPVHFNIVDFIDEDEISHPFGLSLISTGAGLGQSSGPGTGGFVFGVELPKVILNEALIDGTPGGTCAAGGALVAGGDVNGDRLSDIVLVPCPIPQPAGSERLGSFRSIIKLDGVPSNARLLGDPNSATDQFFFTLEIVPKFWLLTADSDASLASSPEYYDYPGQYSPSDNIDGLLRFYRQPSDAPPAVMVGNDVTIVEGQTFNQTGVFTAGGGAWTMTVDYGDGSGEQPLAFNADKSFALNHTYTDDGNYTVTISVTDDHGGVGTDTLTVTATNALPHIGGVIIAPVLERQLATLQGSVTDANPFEPLAVTIDWGDGTTPQTLQLPLGATTFTATHRYAHDGTFQVKVSVSDDDGSRATTNLQVNVQNVDIIVVGADAGAGPHVRVFDANTNKLKFDFDPYQSNFHGGVRVAVGDVNGDGIPDIITAPGVGGAPQVKVFDGVTGQLTRSFFGLEKTFFGGIYVGAGDVNGDGHADIIVGRGSGNSQVRVFSGADGSVLSSFFAYPVFTGGVHVAAGDVNGDGYFDIITAPAGGTSGPQVKVFDGKTGTILQSFFAYAPTFHGGIFVAAGDINGDGKDDIITGAGPGAGPHVKVFDGASLQAIDSFFAYYPGFHAGVRVAVGDVNGDGIPDIITGAGHGAAQPLRAFDGVSLAALDSFFALDPRTSKGFFVAGSR
jgi:hypothetical protein